MYSGIDAPEMNMEYGQEAKDALKKLIQEKPLKILVYDKDPYDRWVGDVYCNGVFIQVQVSLMNQKKNLCGNTPCRKNCMALRFNM